MVIERVAVDFPKVAGFVHAQDDGLQPAVEAAHDLLGTDLLKIPRADSVPRTFHQGIFTDALRPAEHECVVDFCLRLLPPLGAPLPDVVGVVGVDLVDVVEPHLRFGCIAGDD